MQNDSMRFHALAVAFLDAIEACDWARLHDLCAPDLVIWHNVDLQDKPFFPYLPHLAAVRGAASGWRYAETGYGESGDRFFRQSLLTATSRTGAGIEVGTCIIGTVKDGRIVRIDEYYHADHIAPLLAGLDEEGTGER